MPEVIALGGNRRAQMGDAIWADRSSRRSLRPVLPRTTIAEAHQPVNRASNNAHRVRGDAAAPAAHHRPSPRGTPRLQEHHK
jgi:hypothetical protein